jgi:hypothetical protein
MWSGSAQNHSQKYHQLLFFFNLSLALLVLNLV